MKYLVFSLFLALPAWAQIERPQVTWSLDPAGALRPVQGVAGSASVGDAVITDVLSLACSPRLCVAKTALALYSSLGAMADAPEGPAMFAIGETAVYVYFPWSAQFAVWRDERLDFLDLSTGGDVLSLRAAWDGFDYAVARDDSTWIEHYSVDDGSVIALASLGSTGAVLLTEGGGALVASESQVRMMRPRAGEQPLDDLIFDIPGAGQFSPTSNAYVQISTYANGQPGTWLLRMDADAPQAFLLPPPPPPPLPPPPSEETPRQNDAPAQGAGQ